MNVDSTRVFEAGPMDAWRSFRLAIPGLPPAAKQFLRQDLSMNGMEISLNSMRPGTAMPFVHRHQNNEETYLFLSGSGQFHADGEVISIRSGTCVCCAPQVRRSWRNSGDTDLIFVVIQALNQDLGSSNILDGEIVDDPVPWSD